MVEIPSYRRIVSPECVEAMLHTAYRMLQAVGIETNRQDLLDKVRGLPGFTVRGKRIYVSEEAVQEVIEQIRLENGLKGGWPDKPEITVPDRATLYADHHAGVHRPLCRNDLVSAAKLIHSLGNRSVKGTTVGVPQDTILPLQLLEQYLIGFRYNGAVGHTSVLIPPETQPYYYRIREIAEDFDIHSQSFSVWVPSPMRLEGNELDELMDFEGEVTSFYVGSMPVMGLTGPVDPLGAYTLSLAETLGEAAILHQIFPKARVSFYPHPQPMDPRTGLMAFGTPEWCRLELIKKEIFEHLGIQPWKRDILTSAPMPDAQAQSDKMAGIAFGVSHGFTQFNLFPLSGEEAWSPVQLVLDVEYVHIAWEIQQPISETARVEAALGTLVESIRENRIFGEMEDTVSHLRENYYRSPLLRSYRSGHWNSQGCPKFLDAVECYAQELVDQADYRPPEDQLQRVLEVYHAACREFGAHPMVFN